MKLIIDVPDKLVCEGFERPFTEEERDILIRAIGNGTSYNPTDKNDCEGCCHYTYDGDIPYCELGHSIQERCKKFRGADKKGGTDMRGEEE